MTYYNCIFLSPFQNIKPQFLYVKMLSKNYLNSASKTNTCCVIILINIISLASVSPLHIFFPILPREEKLWQRKRRQKETTQQLKIPPGLAPSHFLLIILCAILVLQTVCANEFQIFIFKSPFPVSWNTQGHINISYLTVCVSMGGWRGNISLVTCH